jgi:hypothetical protein
MNKLCVVALACAGAAIPIGSAQATLLTNGNLDLVQDVEVSPGFFLPKPASWQNVGFRTVTGPYEDEMSSEPWAGPAPTPVTADGLLNPVPYNNPDNAVFFKGFTGNASTGNLATGHLYQDVPAIPGIRYDLTGWAGAEQNYLGGAEFAIDFLDGVGDVLASVTLDLLAAGLKTDNGQPFDYKQYELSGVAPVGTAFVRARASMLDASSNPAGGGQAFVVDDFVLVPAPSVGALGLAFGAVTARRRR